MYAVCEKVQNFEEGNWNVSAVDVSYLYYHCVDVLCYLCKLAVDPIQVLYFMSSDAIVPEAVFLFFTFNK